MKKVKTSPTMRRQFASDNYAGICPEAFAAMREANEGHAKSYGNDYWTERASDMIREVFQKKCEVYFVFNGTAANSLALASLCQSYHSFLCHEMAHIETSECGAPEFFANGSKVLLLPGDHAKIDLTHIDRLVNKRTDIHYPKPRVLSITQVTEVGTVYTIPELRRLIAEAHKYKLRIQMDGARFSNAVASLAVKPADITWKLGVDVLCFGGTKNGMAVGEAVVFFDTDLAKEFDYRCKQAGQLASKMRFLAAPWVGVLKNGAWLRHATHSNNMAKLLEELLRTVSEVTIVHPCESNSVFARLPLPAIAAMHKIGWAFYTHVSPGVCRLMCAWDTTEKDVREFVDDLKKILKK